MSNKYICQFGEGRDMKELLGGKGAILAEMKSMGLPVPSGFTVTTAACNYYIEHARFPDGIRSQLRTALGSVEGATGRRFGDSSNPLLLSVRFGACAPMPGMMQTIPNLGLNDETVQGVAKHSDSELFAYQCYCRFVGAYANAALSCTLVRNDERDPSDDLLGIEGKTKEAAPGNWFTVKGLKELVTTFKTAAFEATGRHFPDDPMQQLWGAIGAAFQSWNNQRAIAYRRLYGIPDIWGTAVNCAAMSEY
jgi:pyruvate,orthophosphate dikinase